MVVAQNRFQDMELAGASWLSGRDRVGFIGVVARQAGLGCPSSLRRVVTA
jgi:hypothetical protein